MRTKAVLAGALIVLLAGCDGELTYELEVHPDGTGSFAIDITWVPSDADRARVDDPDLFHFTEDMTRSEIAAQVRDLYELEEFAFDPDAEVEVTTEGEVEGLRITMAFDSYDEMGEQLEPVPFSSLSIEEQGVDSNGAVRLSATIESLQVVLGGRPGPTDEDDADLDLSFRLQLPNEPSETNADAVDGRSASWNLDPNEPRSIEATWMPNTEATSNTALWALGTLGILAVIVGGWLILRRRTDAS